MAAKIQGKRQVYLLAITILRNSKAVSYIRPLGEYRATGA